MPEKTIGLIAAMPEEINPLIRRIGKVTREKHAGFAMFRFRAGTKEVFLVKTGIGTTRAALATRALIDVHAPGLLLNFGFGGAVLPGLAVGDIVVAERVLFFKERLFASQEGLTQTLATSLTAILQTEHAKGSIPVHQGVFITTGEIASKRMLARRLPAGVANPVVEMETAGIARIALERQVPLAAIRTISDDALEELDFSITDFTDREMRIRIGKVLWTVARKPRLIPQLLRLGKNSRLAGEHLADAMLLLLEHL